MSNVQDCDRSRECRNVSKNGRRCKRKSTKNELQTTQGIADLPPLSAENVNIRLSKRPRADTDFNIDVDLLCRGKGRRTSNSDCDHASRLLFDGVFKNDTAAVKRILSRGVSVNSVCTCNALGFTPLHIAVHYGYSDLVGLLLDFDADVNAPDSWLRTPIHQFNSDRPDIARVLLSAGANVNAAALSGRTPLWETSAAGFASVVRVLIDNGAMVNAAENEGMTCLAAAAAWGHEEIVRQLIECGADVNLHRATAQPPLHYAADEGYVAIAGLLLDAGAEIQSRNCLGQTALHFALAHGKTETARLLIERGADFEARDKNGATPLLLAVEYGSESTDVARLLIDHGAVVNCCDDEGNVPLQLTSDSVVAVHLIENGADVSVVDDRCNSLLLYHIDNGHLDILRLLLSGGVSSDVRCNDGNSALLMSAEAGFNDTVELLVEYEADMFARDKYGRSAVQLAAYNGHLEIADYLRKIRRHIHKPRVPSDFTDTIAGCVNLTNANHPKTVDGQSDQCYRNLHSNNNLLLHVAVTAPQIAVLLASGNDIEAENIFGSRPLHCAARLGVLDCVPLLLEHGACVDATDIWGNTALHEAAITKSEIINVLVRHKASVNAQNIFGKTPLHCAVEDGNEDVAISLLTHGADPTLVDHWSNTALHYAPCSFLANRFCTRAVIQRFNKSCPIASLLERENFLGTSVNDRVEFYSSWKSHVIKHDERQNNSMSADILGNTELHRMVGVYRNAKMLPVDGNGSRSFGNLLSRQPSLFIQRNCNGHTPLHVACGKRAFRECYRFADRNCFRMTDDRGRNFWHVLRKAGCNWNADASDLNQFRTRGFATEPLFRATDKFGRNALHYSAMHGATSCFTQFMEGFKLLYGQQDFLGRTPLHYASLSMTERMDGMDSDLWPDVNGMSVVDYRSMAMEYRSRTDQCHSICFKSSSRILQDFRELAIQSGLTGCLSAETVAACRQSSNGSSMDPASFVWNIWENRLFRYDRQHDESVRSAITVLVENILNDLLCKITFMDECFESLYLRAGSSSEKTKVDALDEFDYMVNFDRLSDACEVVEDPVSPGGYYYLRCKYSNTRRMAKCAKYFDQHGFLNTRFVKLRFEALMKLACEEYQRESNEEIVFIGNDVYDFSPLNVGSKVKIKLMVRLVPTPQFKPYLLHTISVDIVPAIYICDWRPAEARFVDPALEPRGSYFIFDQPQRKCPWITWSPSHARIDFSLSESAIIGKQAPVVRAAYIVVKQIAKNFCDYTFFKSFVLKSAVLHCIMDGAYDLSFATGTSYTDIDKEQLLNWCRKIIRCLLCFVLQDFVPSPFMPSFTMPVCTFEPHLKFMHMRMHQYGLTYRDLVTREFITATMDGRFKDSQLLMTLKVYICCHLMYHCLLPQNTRHELIFPDVHPLSETLLSQAVLRVPVLLVTYAPNELTEGRRLRSRTKKLTPVVYDVKTVRPIA